MDNHRPPQAPPPHSPLELTDLALRQSLMASHPIATGEFIVPTPPIRQAFDAALSHVLLSRPGLAFAAHPRFGKTTALDYFAQKLPESFPDASIYQVIARSSVRPSPDKFFRQLGESCGGGYTYSRGKTDPMARLVRFWLISAHSEGAKRIVLLVDETQRLRIAELTYLADATNAVRYERMPITVICVGQPELCSTRDLLMNAHRGDILGRFLTPLYPFQGITSSLELKEIMGFFDDPAHADYPEGSGWSYSRFFFPMSYAHGWRLADEADALWTAFDGASRDYLGKKSDKRLEIGMAYVIAAIQEALIFEQDFDGRQRPIDAARWQEAVQASDFVASLGTTYLPGVSAVTAPGRGGYEQGTAAV